MAFAFRSHAWALAGCFTNDHDWSTTVQFFRFSKSWLFKPPHQQLSLDIGIFCLFFFLGWRIPNLITWLIGWWVGTFSISFLSLFKVCESLWRIPNLMRLRVVGTELWIWVGVFLSFLALVVTVIILIHFVVAIFSSHMYAQHVFLVLFTGGSNTIACGCRRGVEAGFSQLVYRWRSFPAWGICSGEGSVSPFFSRGWCVCVVCVCIRTHCMWGTRMWAQVLRQDTWRARKKSRCTVAIAYIFTVQCTNLKSTCIYICCATGRSLD